MRGPAAIVVLLGLAVALFAATASARPQQAVGKQLCTSFGKTWAHKYNADGGPIKIVTACCALRSLRTGNSLCKVMVTGRKGMMGAGTFGCSIATVTRSGNILANRPQACVRIGGGIALPT